jgi:DNA-directed RNA polymerase subunit RPC12/RpoP
MALVQATATERCGHCGRALLIPLLREVGGSTGAAPRALARCARCGSRNLVQPTDDPTAARRAAAISFVTRGAGRPRH